MRRRLVWLSFAVTSMVALAFLVPLGILVRDLARDRALVAAEREAEGVARFLALAVGGRDLEASVEILGLDRGATRFEVSVIAPDGTVFGADPLPEEDLDAARSGRSFRIRVSGGEVAYVPVVLGDGGVAAVRVFVPDAVLTEGVARSWVTLGLLGLVLVSVAVAIADRLGRSMVEPVRDLSRVARRLGEGDLDARVEPSGPEELVEVGTELNQLAGRIRRLLQEERETAADLSHRLRTPLTVLGLDVE
ncbi:MAG TPA: HAMP domain-containing protein, partial [Actinobacteria bacterium]|nr:HAMP domain-containing protein [Actinomycetota bacterium]